MAFFRRTSDPDPRVLSAIQSAVVGLDLEDVFQVTPAGVFTVPSAIAPIAADILGPGEGVPSTQFTRNVSPVDIWSLAHLGVGAALAASGFGTLALVAVALGTEGVEFLLQREGILQQETVQNRIGDLVAAAVGFGAVRALT